MYERLLGVEIGKQKAERVIRRGEGRGSGMMQGHRQVSWPIVAQEVERHWDTPKFYVRVIFDILYLKVIMQTLKLIPIFQVLSIFPRITHWKSALSE